jgi:hypothetical protein
VARLILEEGKKRMATIIFIQEEMLQTTPITISSLKRIIIVIKILAEEIEDVEEALEEVERDPGDPEEQTPIFNVQMEHHKSSINNVTKILGEVVEEEIIHQKP